MKKFAVAVVVLCPPTTRWQALGGMVSKQPWPLEVEEMLSKLGGDLTSPFTKWPVFLLPEQIEAARLAAQKLREMGMPPVLEYGTVRNPSADNIGSVNWYSVLYPDSGDGFITQGMFENEWPCGLPTPERVTGVHGCSLRKRQLRKLKVGQRDKIKSSDFLSASSPFYSFPWQKLVITARLRDALLDSGFSGFSFLPIAGEKASAEDMLLEVGSCSTDSKEWFQWVIDARAHPKPITDFISVKRADGRQDCSICGRKTGDAQRTPLFEERLLDSAADVQVCDEFVLPDGQRIMNDFGGELLASGRFVEFCVRNKFKGLSTLKGRAPSFVALYFGPAL